MPTVLYQIRLQENLPPGWANEFQKLVITHEPDGTTSLTGPIHDQAALFGVLQHLYGLGLTLLSVTPLAIIKNRPQPAELEK